MAIITFWNNNTGKIGQTHSAIALATYMGVEHNYKILLISTKYGDRVTFQAFGTNQRIKTLDIFNNKKRSMDLESGLEGMAKLAAANRLSPEMIQNYTNVVYKNRLEVVTAPAKKDDLDYNKIYQSCINILSAAKKYYDILIVDLNNGINNETTQAILKMSNIIILNMEQKTSELKSLINLREKYNNIFSSKNTLYLINNYDKKSKYSTKNISRELGEKKEVLSVPYDNLLADSVQEGKTAEFFLNARIKRLENEETRTGFLIRELKRVADAVIYKLQELQMRI